MTVERLRACLADRYRIERELGAGGMATVCLAHDLRHDRDVAVKVLREDLAAALGGGRFLREIKIAAQLQHPHILPLLDSGEADGFLFFVMPYVKGQSLRERLAREGELPVSEAVRLLIEVVDALVGASLADRYRLERELGQGGMATVYLAQDLKHDARSRSSAQARTGRGAGRRAFRGRGSNNSVRCLAERLLERHL